MDFFSVVLILLVYYIRPQDWVPGLIGVGIVTPIMGVAIISMITAAKREGRKIRLFLSPLDWTMLTYYLYIVTTHPDPSGALKDALPLFAFYLVTVQALNTTGRLIKYLKYWLLALLALAIFGLGSKMGFDPTGAIAMTDANKGRLALGTWMHNNPNALGHSVIMVLPLAYLLYFWKRGFQHKLLAIGLWFLAFECVWQTESKGAVLAGFGALVLAYVFGKPKIVQILVLVAALAGGGAAISVMPRMSEMGSLRSDEGVQGRLLAWEQARTASRTNWTGSGWKTFTATIRWEKLWLKKATHSGYVQLGAELGPVGMTIYVGLFWLGLRSLIRAGVLEGDPERCRRCLFALLIGFAISNWMIDRAYHTEFFLFMAGISAFHRLHVLHRLEMEVAGAGEVTETERTPAFQPDWNWAGRPALAMAGPPSFAGEVMHKSSPAAPLVSEGAGPRVRVAGPPRSAYKPSLLDFLVAAAGAWVVFYLWDYILKNL